MSGPIRRLVQRVRDLWNVPEAWTTIARANVSDYTLTGASVRVEGWEKHPVLQAATRAIVDVVQSVPLEVTAQEGDDLTVLPTHPLARLLANPSPQAPNFPGPRFLGLTALHFLLYGNAFWYIRRNGQQNRGKPVGLKLIHPEYVRSAEYSEQEDRIVWYDWTSPETGVPRKTPADDVVHFADLAAGGGALFGYPRAAAALADIALDAEATRYVRQVVTNDGAATQVFHMAEGATRESAEAAEARWRQKRLQRGDRGMAVFLPGSVSTETLGFNLQQLEFPDLRRVTREDICAAFQVDPRIIGIASAGSDGGLSGVQYREARRRLIAQAVSPLMFALEGQINHWLAPEFGEVQVRFSPDGLSELTEDELETSQRAITEFTAGIRTLEEARTLVALPSEQVPTDHVKAGMMGVLTVADQMLLGPATAQAALGPPPPPTGAATEDEAEDEAEDADETAERTRRLLRAVGTSPPFVDAARDYDESQHPRDPSGTPTGGQWTSKNTVARVVTASEESLADFAESPDSTEKQHERGVWIDGETGEVYADVTSPPEPNPEDPRWAPTPGVIVGDHPNYGKILDAKSIIQLHTHPEVAGPSDGDLGLFAYGNYRQMIVVDPARTAWRLDKTPEFDALPHWERTPRKLREAWERHLDAMFASGEYKDISEREMMDRATARTVEEFHLKLTKYAVPKSKGRTARTWDESKHPRDPAGTETGGRWTSKEVFPSERAIMGQKFETVLAYREPGEEPYFRKDGTQNEVAFDHEDIAEARIMTHNHPTGSAFSETDIWMNYKCAADGRLDIARVITPMGTVYEVSGFQAQFAGLTGEYRMTYAIDKAREYQNVFEDLRRTKYEPQWLALKEASIVGPKPGDLSLPAMPDWRPIWEAHVQEAVTTIGLKWRKIGR